MSGSNHHLPMTQDDIHPAPEMSSPNDSKIGQNEKLASPTTNMVSDEVDIAPTSEKNHNKYAVDAFSAQREGAGEDYLDFRTMGWFQAGLVSTAENIALGLLSFPSVYLRLGIAGGMIATVVLGTLAYITAWIMVDFKVKYMGVMNIGDAGELMFGKWGRRWFGWGLVLKAMGLAGSHVLAGEEALRSLSSNSICGVWWGLIVAIFSILISYSREWGKLSLWAFVSLLCILTASFITIVGTGVQDPSILVKGREPIHWHAWPQNPNLMDIIGGLTNIVFAYGGNMAVFTFCSEMKKPNDFKKSFLMNQGLGTLMYILVGALVYVFGGQYVTSPAFTMLSHTLTIVAYAFALVTIIISGILAANIGAKYLYVHSLRDSALLTSNGWKSRFIWIGIVSLVWFVAFLISQLIPFFNQLLTIVSSLFSVWLTYGSAGIIWFWDSSPVMRNFARDANERKMDSRKKWFFGGVSILVICLSLAITPLGLYSAIEGIRAGYSKGTYSRPFAC